MIKDASYGSAVCLAMFACIGFYFGFSILWLLYYTCSYPAFYLYSIPPVSCSYLIILWVFPTWYDSDLPIHVCLPMLATWLSHHHSPGSSDSSGSSCPGFGAWSMWILPVTDQSGAAVAWISSRSSRAPSFQAPLFGSRVFLLWLWVSILYYSYLYIYLYSRICAILVM